MATFGTSTSKWWLTIAQRSKPCAECEAVIESGDVVGYCHGLKRMVCRPCLKRLGVNAQPSRRLETTEAPRLEAEALDGPSVVRAVR